MNDFLTDDFVSKNIRIRPSSGKGTEEGKEMRSYNSKAKMDSQADEQYKEEQRAMLEFRET